MLICYFYRFIVEEGKMSYKSRKGVWLEVVLSCTQREHIPKACRSDPTAGHLGRTKTFYKISERYYWPGLYKEVKKFVSICSYICWRRLHSKYNIEEIFCILFIR